MADFIIRDMIYRSPRRSPDPMYLILHCSSAAVGTWTIFSAPHLLRQISILISNAWCSSSSKSQQGDLKYHHSLIYKTYHVYKGSIVSALAHLRQPSQYHVRVMLYDCCFSSFRICRYEFRILLSKELDEREKQVIWTIFEQNMHDLYVVIVSLNFDLVFMKYFLKY